MSSGLATPSSIGHLASQLLRVGELLHAALRRASSREGADISETYRLLTEEYALKSRAHILSLEPHCYTVDGLLTSDETLASLLHRITDVIEGNISLKSLSVIVADLMAFTTVVFTRKPHLILFMVTELEKSVSTAV